MQVLVVGDGPLPKYATSGSAGADLCAYISAPLTINPNEIKLIPTGIKIKIPDGYEGQIRPRSGLSLKGVTVANSPGCIDADFRGEVCIILANISTKPYTINPYDKIAQLIIAKVERASFEVATVLDETSRGQGGFGSTGV